VVLVPERVDLDRPTPSAAKPGRASTHGVLTVGAAEFLTAVESVPEPRRTVLLELVEWASDLEARGLVTLQTYRGRTQTMLLPRLKDEQVGLVTISSAWSTNLGVWRSVFERRAPSSLPVVEALVAPRPVGQGTGVDVSAELLAALTKAYEEATGS
jgi:hypothetical protein